MELNKEQIKKALECCHSHSFKNCPNCPYNKDTEKSCFMLLMEHSLSLIKELTDENESLHASCTEFERKCASLNDENERLRADVAKEFTCVFGTPHKVSECPVFEEVAEAKADTVRKMQERIAEHATNGYPRKVRLDVIEQIAKEMLEDVK